MKSITKDNQLLNYALARDSALTTTEIIKDSFKNAFKKQDETGFVIIKNNRRKEESVLVSMKEYTKLIKTIEKLEEEKFDLIAGKIDPKNYDFVDAKELDL